MAQRFYLTNSAAPYTPTTKRGGWEQAGATLARLLGSRPAGTAATAAVATGSTGAANDVLWGRWVSAGALTAGTLSGTVQAIVGAVESNAATNAFLYLHIFVTAGDSDTVRGTALNGFVGGTEFTTTANGRDSGAQTLTSVAVSVGDRLVIEIGYRSISADTTARTATLNYGNTGTTDLAAAATTVTTNPGWVDFSGADGIWSRPMSGLVEAFSGASLPSTFSGIGGTPSVSGGVLHLAATSYTGVITAAGYQLRGSSLVMQLPATPATSGSYAGVRIGDTDGTGKFVGSYNLPGDASISFEMQPSDPAYTSITFAAPPTAQWRKFDFTTSSLLLYSSDDGSTWTLRRTITTIPQFLLWSDLIVVFETDAGTGGDELQVDNVNNPPSATNGTATVTGVGSVSAAGSVIVPGTASVTGAGSVTATGSAVQIGTASVTGAGTVTSSSAQGAGSSVTGVGATTAAATQPVAGATTGTGTVSATSSQIIRGSATVTGAGSVSASPSQTLRSTSSVTGTGSVSTSVTHWATANQAGMGAVTAAAIQAAGSTVTGVGSVSANAGGTVAGTASVAGAGAVTAGATQASGASVSGAGSVAAAPTVRTSTTVTGQGSTAAASALSATSSVTGAGTVSANAAGTVTGTASVAGTGSVTASATQRAGSTVAGSGTVSGASTTGGTASLSGVGVTSAVVRQLPTAAVVGSGSVSATVTAVVYGTASVMGSGVVTADTKSRIVRRPDAGTVIRPNSGTTSRPFAGTVARP